MFRDRVVGHYVGRGYRVDADPVLTGDSGGEYRLGLLASDDIGRIALWWGDQEPFEGPELESLKRAARDLGAAPAIALPEATNTLRDHARKHGVVIVDEALLEAESAKGARPLPPRPLPDEPASNGPDAVPAWPDPDRVPDPRADAPETSPTVQAPWKQRDAGAPAPEPGSVTAGRRSFDWLGDDQTSQDAADLVPPQSSRRTTDIMPAFWGPVLYTAIALLVIIVVLAFVL